DALEEAALVAAAVRVEVLEVDPLGRRELIGDVAHDAELRPLCAALNVVRAGVLELAGPGHSKEAAVFLDVLLLVGVGDAGHHAEAATEAAAPGGAPVLAGAAAPVDRKPLVPEGA